MTRSKPEKSLVKGKTKHRRAQRARAHHEPPSRRRRKAQATAQIDFKRRKDGVPAKVAAIEYDPNRSAHIALLHYADGEKRYILAPQRLTVGMQVVSGERREIQVGNCLPLARIPTGTVVHNVELTPGRGGQLGRSAGAAIQLVAKEGDYATLRLPSGEMRMVPANCRATIGAIGNADHENVSIGKAGRNRHKGIRPQTRGTAMNPVDHPHGGGEGKTTAGRHPVTPWGVPTLGYRTRKKSKPSNRYIVRGRRRGKRRRRSRWVARPKKGPWVEERLMKRIQQMNESGEKRIVKTWSRASTIFPEMVGHTIARARRPQARPRLRHASRWSATSSASSRPRGCSAATPAPTGPRG